MPVISKLNSLFAVCMFSLLASPAAAEQRMHIPSRQQVEEAVQISPLQDYTPFSDQEVGNWIEMNETVRKIGGWRVYAMEPYRKSGEPMEGMSQGHHHSGGAK